MTDAIIISFGIIVLFSLYLLFKGVEYRETIRRLQEDNKELRKCNQNLANIIQEDIKKKHSFETNCG
jgi:predicted PurR-regulated permease PerM